jgi:glutamate-1-semialdehyde 2,1-aminomutase
MNEGKDIVKGRGPALWERAKRIIPGGGQLLSKRSEKFLPGLWPAYYAKAKGCEVWDLDGKRYYDFAQMGVGSCVLGYADEEVNAAVIAAVQQGSMSTLNCPEEIELAEALVRLHPWAEMVRFARTGGEACAVAVRIARAASGRSKVAFCGYHGWHDWYLSANLGNTANLDGQLLPGLDPAGVPRELKDTAVAFNYNKLNELEKIAANHPGEIGVIIMEPERGVAPVPGFLEGIRAIASRIGAVLVFDEVTSGFRMNLGGIHLNSGIAPDVAVFGKAMGNGYPIAAVIGRREVMEHAQDTFISSTFWTERIGFVAALATLKKMEMHHVQNDLIRYGKHIQEIWTRSAQRHHLDIHVSGIPPLSHIAFKTEQPLAVQTLYAQEMLERGYLLGAAVYTTYAYTDDLLNRFGADTDAVFGLIKEAVDKGSLGRRLRGEVLHAGFKRLTS